METPVPIALVDDHELLRGTLADMINGLPEYQVVLEAGNGIEFVRAMKQGAQVSVAVVDLHMPVMDGYATIKWIRENAPETRVLALSFEISDEALAQALRLGACGFVRKDCGRVQFLDALNQVAVLGRYRSPSEIRQAELLREEHEQQRKVALRLLTDRELEYIRLVCHEAELTNVQMAETMGVHRRTIDGYRESVHEKCDVKTKAGLVVFAHKWGLME